MNQETAEAIIKRINLNCEEYNTGLKLTFAYHCNRCDYLWFPKDFDDFGKYMFRDIMNLIPPKSCARCKTRSWNKPIQRKMKLPAKVKVPDGLNDGMLRAPRIKAIQRNIERRKGQIEQLRKQIPIPIPVPNKKRKKKQ